MALRCAGEELADGIEGTEENGGRGARGAGDGGLIDEFDAGEVLGAFEFLDGRGVAFGFLAELAGEVQIEDVVGEGGFAGAGDAGEADEEAEREIDVEFLEVVAGGAADGEEFFGGLAAGVRGWRWICWPVSQGRVPS